MKIRIDYLFYYTYKLMLFLIFIAEGSFTFENLIRFSTNLNFIITVLLAGVIIIFNNTILGLFDEEFQNGNII
jgi:hypothetical protein